MGKVTPMALFMKRHGCRCQLYPKRKKYVKTQIKRNRRKLLKKGLEEIKLAYNNGVDIQDIDYYRDGEYIKKMSRQGVDADFIEQRTTNSRVTVADNW